MSDLIRNFSIIAHIDHGKSTLADRLLELTETIERRKMKEQFLDMMELEREKGITIKLQPVRMDYKGCALNLIDTPGHVDFSYEVSRSLAAVEGAILLVDAGQGVQAQTLANLRLAQELGLAIVPVINKIDLPQARVQEVEGEIREILEDGAGILKVSAKTGVNIGQVLEEVVKRIPAPGGNQDKPLRALIFDSVYDSFKGAIAYVRVVDGEIKAGDKITMMAQKVNAEVMEVGFFRPQLVKADRLAAGEIGYVATGLKGVENCRVGDTIGSRAVKEGEIKPLSGYREPMSVVFASFFPAQEEGYDDLKDGLSKLKLNDASLVYAPESSQGLGRGFRCGFLGMLHLEIVLERLKREYGLSLVVSSPSVNYQVTTKDSKTLSISSAEKLPEVNRIEKMKEPWVDLEIIAPGTYLGQTMKLVGAIRSRYQDTQYLASKRVLLKYKVPLSEIIVDFYDKLKNATSGYGSMSYDFCGYEAADLVKMDILVAGEKVEAFSRIIHRDKVNFEARALVKKLKDVLPPQLFAVPIQAAIGGQIIARETLRAMRKDVTGYLYGGDVTRKKKLLEKQKKGKKKMKAVGKVNIPQEVFFKVLKK